jgi:PTS system mannose-specific IIA component
VALINAGGDGPFLRRVGLAIIAHAGLVEFRAALEHIVGPQQQVETCSNGPDDDVELRRQQLIEAVARADSGAGVVLLTDIFGGTPSNMAISVMEATGAEVIEEVNLPMLIHSRLPAMTARLSKRWPSPRKRGGSISP